MVLIGPSWLLRNSDTPSEWVIGIMVENQTGANLSIARIVLGNGAPLSRAWHRHSDLWLRPGEFVMLPVAGAASNHQVLAIDYRIASGNMTHASTHWPASDDRAIECDLRVLIGPKDATFQRSCRPPS